MGIAGLTRKEPVPANTMGLIRHSANAAKTTIAETNGNDTIFIMLTRIYHIRAERIYSPKEITYEFSISYIHLVPVPGRALNWRSSFLAAVEES
jgi:hypothetical protein